MKIKNQETASALIASMIILSVIILTGLSLFSVMLKDKRLSMGSAESNKAFQAADTGLEEAINIITQGVSNGDIKEIRDIEGQLSGFSCNASNNALEGSYISLEFKNEFNETINCDSLDPIENVVTIKSTGKNASKRNSRSVESDIKVLSAYLEANPSFGTVPPGLSTDISVEGVVGGSGSITYSNPSCDGGVLSNFDSSTGFFTCDYSSTGEYCPSIDIDRGDLSETFEKCIDVDIPTLTAVLSAAPSSGNNPLVSSLTTTVGGTVTGEITYSNHSCGGGTISNISGGSFMCAYNANGNYTAEVKVSRGGLEETASTIISVDTPLTVTLSASPTSGPTTLDSYLTTAVGGSATGAISYSNHSCGGGTISNISGGSFKCRYSSAGTYTARITVTRDGNTLTDTERIIAYAPSSLIVALTANPSNGGTPLVTNLTTAVSGGSGGIVYSNHSCGGGTISNISGGSFTCTYNSPGSYTASIVVIQSGMTSGGTVNICVGDCSTSGDLDGDGHNDCSDFCPENSAEYIPKRCGCADRYDPTSCCISCDINGDGFTSFTDVIILRDLVGQCVVGTSYEFIDGYDIPVRPRNGMVDIEEYKAWLDNCYVQC